MSTNLKIIGQGGMTLPELAIAMAITGLMSVIVWQSLPSLKVWESIGPVYNDDVVRSRNALLGHLYVHKHLPYADNAVNSTGHGTHLLTTGRLPVRKLELPSTIQLDYRVDAVLANSKDHTHAVPVMRSLPNFFTNQQVARVFSRTPTEWMIDDITHREWKDVLPQISRLSLFIGQELLLTESGLDTCSRLTTALRKPTLTSNDIPAAFSLQRLSATTPQDDASKGLAFSNGAVDDEDILAMGAGEISQIFRCPYSVNMLAGKTVSTEASVAMAAVLREQTAYLQHLYHTNTAALNAERADLAISTINEFIFLTNLAVNALKAYNLYTYKTLPNRMEKLALSLVTVGADLLLIARNTVILVHITSKNLPEKSETVKKSKANLIDTFYRTFHAWEFARANQRDVNHLILKGLLP
jgi:prepilin-type N-terminal cleavage/methylation domain-containing protein